MCFDKFKMCESGIEIVYAIMVANLEISCLVSTHVDQFSHMDQLFVRLIFINSTNFPQFSEILSLKK